MKLKKEKAIKLLKILGFHTAHKMDCARLTEKMNKLSSIIELKDCKKPKAKELLKKIFDTTDAGTKIKVYDPDDKQVEEDFNKHKKNKTKEAAKTKKIPAKEKTKKVGSKGNGKSKPGVVATIVEMIKAKPMTKETILDKLSKKFPDRDPKGMSHTVTIQLGSRLKADKGINVKCDDKGRYSIK